MFVVLPIDLSYSHALQRPRSATTASQKVGRTSGTRSSPIFGGTEGHSSPLVIPLQQPAKSKTQGRLAALGSSSQLSSTSPTMLPARSKAPQSAMTGPGSPIVKHIDCPFAFIQVRAAANASCVFIMMTCEYVQEVPRWIFASLLVELETPVFVLKKYVLVAPDW
jgi:hypothetical protein